MITMDVYFDGKKLSNKQYIVNGSTLSINEEMFDGLTDKNGNLIKPIKMHCKYTYEKKLNRQSRRKSMNKKLNRFNKALMAMSNEEKAIKVQEALDEFLKIDIDYNLAKRKLNEIREGMK